MTPKFTLHGAIQTFHWKRPYEWKPGPNTVAYYPLNSTTTVNDMSGNNRNLTNSGGTFGVYQGVDSCYINGMLYYNGITNPNQFTISCFYNLRSRADHYYLLFGIKNGTGVDTNNQFELGEFDGRPDGNGFGVQYILSNTAYGLTEGTEGTIGTWYHGVVTYDGTTLKIYLNGALVNSRTVNLSATRDTIFLGYNSENSQVNISNAILEDKARTEEEIVNYYNRSKVNYEPKPRVPNANTLAYFPFKSDSLDHSGNGKTLTNGGTKASIGYNFSDNSEISGGISEEVLFAGCWIKVNSASGTGASAVILCLNPNMAYYPYASTYLNNKLYVCYNSSYSYQSANGPSDINTWHYICFGYDGSKTIYGIDGVVNTLYNGKGYNRGTNIYLLLKDSGITCSFNLSDVILEKRCRTTQEIADYYNLTKSNYGL